MLLGQFPFTNRTDGRKRIAGESEPLELTELGAISFPDVYDAQASLGTHDLDVILGVLVRIEPVNFFASLDYSI